MTDLRRAVDDYIALRRSLGFKLGPHPRLLADFVAYLEAAGANTISIQLAVSWAAQPPDGNPVWWSQRLGVVRGFAAHLRAFDPDTEVPPAGLLPRRSYRPEPYVYLPAEIAGLMATARAMADPLRAATVETLIGLIASCGLRPGEALSLERNDLDWTEGLLDIRNAKFNKHRKVPLHPSTLASLGDVVDHAHLDLRNVEDLAADLAHHFGCREIAAVCPAAHRRVIERHLRDAPSQTRAWRAGLFSLLSCRRSGRRSPLSPRLAWLA